jgi:hypothetical protein
MLSKGGVEITSWRTFRGISRTVIRYVETAMYMDGAQKPHKPVPRGGFCIILGSSMM